MIAKKSNRKRNCWGALLIASVAWFSGCTTTDNSEPTANNYVFPRLKYTSEADFSLTKAERKVALQEMRKKDAEVLYEVVAAQDGSIVKIRPVKSFLSGEDRNYFTIGFMQRLQERKLKPSQMSAPYRTFFFPLNVRHTTEFLGAQGFID
jgi:hypothetical protein